MARVKMNKGFISSLVFISSLSVITSAVLKDQNFYESLKLKCPKLDDIPGFRNRTIISNCKNLKALLSVDELSPDTLSDVTCLLYYNSIIDICNEPNVSKGTILAHPNDSNIEEVCTNFTSIANLTNGLLKPEDCLHICNAFPIIKDRCTLSYRFIKAKQESKKNITNTPKVIKSTLYSNYNNKTSGDHPEVNIAKVDSIPKPNVVDPDLSGNINKVQPSTTVKSKENSQPVKGNSSETVNSNPQTVENNDQPVQNKLQHVENNPQPVKISPQPNPNLETYKIEPNDQAPPPVNPAVPLPLQENNINEANEQINSKNLENQVKIAVSTPTPNPIIQENLDDETFNPNPDEDVEDFQDDEKKQSIKSKNVEGSNVSVDDLDEESYFFSYFMVICLMVVLGYVAYHNRQKLFALMIEGKRNKRQNRGRRPNSANYHKLDSNLEEAITSDCSKSTSHIIY